MTTRAWLTDIQLEQYADKFEANDIEVSALESLTDADLQTMGIDSLGHRKKILEVAGAVSPSFFWSA
jgi:hypothetical protein